jgi:hypothetical protein
MGRPFFLRWCHIRGGQAGVMGRQPTFLGMTPPCHAWLKIGYGIPNDTLTLPDVDGATGGHGVARAEAGR